MKKWKVGIAFIMIFVMSLQVVGVAYASESALQNEVVDEEVLENTEAADENLSPDDPGEAKDAVSKNEKVLENIAGQSEYADPLDEKDADLSDEKDTDPSDKKDEDSSEIEDDEQEEPVPVETKKGWNWENGGWYYYKDSGEKATGWLYDAGKWYFLDGTNIANPGRMLSNCQAKISDRIYVFNSDGSMAVGWIWVQGWRYANRDGVWLTGWQYIDNRWYFMDASGLMKTGWIKLGNNWYYLEKDGRMVTGWKYINNKWYFFNSSGTMAVGWIKLSNKWYFMNADGAMQTGWKYINNKWYYLNPSGDMAVRWLYQGGRWYYLATDGAMRDGWNIVDGKQYYFYRQSDINGGIWGTMAKDSVIDGCKIRSDGSINRTAQSDMLLKAEGYSSVTPYMILINRNTCRVGVFTGKTGAWNLKYYWSCAPGKADTPTIAGVFTVGAKGYYFDSYGARCFWYTQFYGDYLLHSVLYHKNGTLMDGRTGIPLSHGCVRLELSNAKWIYDNVPRNTTVVVY